ncbi:GntP family permease, partial [Avibacterium paragallinarum]
MLIFTLIASVLLLLLLIMKFRVHAFVALIIVSLLTALATGVPFNQILPTLTKGFGGTLASVALLVGLGAMIGRLLEITG